MYGSYSADYQAARVLGIKIERGWRKKLSLVSPSKQQAETIRIAIAKKRGAKRLRELAASCTHNGCPASVHAEWEIAGELYFRLRMAGIEAHLEVTVPSIAHDSGLMRADIGIFEHGSLRAVVECKRPGGLVVEGSPQARGYEALQQRYGVAYHFVNCESKMEAIVRLYQRTE